MIRDSLTRRRAPWISAVLLVLAAFVTAASGTQAPEPGAELEIFRGLWHRDGERTTSLLDCHFFDGRFHLVCDGKRQVDGQMTSSLMVFGISPDDAGTFTFLEIDSSGLTLALHGTQADGVFTFADDGGHGGVKYRAVITTSEDRFTVHEERWSGGGPWAVLKDKVYLKLK